MAVPWHLPLILLSVASVLHGHDGNAAVAHAMVLDIYDEDDTWIFKNTYDQEGQPKQVKVTRTSPNAPEELYFVHIRIKDMNSVPGQEKREALRKPEHEKQKNM